MTSQTSTHIPKYSCVSLRNQCTKCRQAASASQTFSRLRSHRNKVRPPACRRPFKAWARARTNLSQQGYFALATHLFRFTPHSCPLLATRSRWFHNIGVIRSIYVTDSISLESDLCLEESRHSAVERCVEVYSVFSPTTFSPRNNPCVRDVEDMLSIPSFAASLVLDTSRLVFGFRRDREQQGNIHYITKCAR